MTTISILNNQTQHVTATEKQAIRQIIDAGQTYGRNRPKTKIYEIIKGSLYVGKSWLYDVKITSVNFGETRTCTVSLIVVKD